MHYLCFFFFLNETETKHYVITVFCCRRGEAVRMKTGYRTLMRIWKGYPASSSLRGRTLLEKLSPGKLTRHVYVPSLIHNSCWCAVAVSFIYPPSVVLHFCIHTVCVVFSTKRGPVTFELQCVTAGSSICVVSASVNHVRFIAHALRSAI